MNAIFPEIVEKIGIFKVDDLKKDGVSEVLGPSSTTIPVGVALEDNGFGSGFLDIVWLDEMTVETTLVEITVSGHC